MSSTPLPCCPLWAELQDRLTKAEARAARMDQRAALADAENHWRDSLYFPQQAASACRTAALARATLAAHVCPSLPTMLPLDALSAPEPPEGS